MSIFDKIDILAIESGCTSVAGEKVNCLWSTENEVLKIKLDWSNLELTLHFPFSQLIECGMSLTDMVIFGFKHHFRAPTPVEQTETPCIRDMCCNQFGERDEMQSIINSLQADVIARGARIKMLEDALRATNDELQGAIENINNTLKSNICSTDLDDPDYWDFQTCHDNAMLLRGVGDE